MFIKDNGEGEPEMGLDIIYIQMEASTRAVGGTT